VGTAGIATGALPALHGNAIQGTMHV
jgi:hypothetical protein